MDTMNIRKVFSPVSSAQKVHRLKKENPDGRKRGFHGELQKEKDGDKSENQDAQATEGRPVAVRSQDKADPGAGQSARETGLKKGEGEDTLGTLVDIRV